MTANEEHHECKLQNIVEDEVAADTSSGIHPGGIAAKEVRDVADLQEEEHNPAGVSTKLRSRLGGQIYQ